jgi:hypothetical protein
MRPSRLVAAAGATTLGMATLVVATPWTAPAQAAPASPDAPAAACPPGQVAQQRTSRGPSGKKITITVCVPGGSTPGGPRPGGPGEGGGGNPSDNDGNYTVCVPWSEAYPGHDPNTLGQGGPGEEAYRCIRYINGAPVYGPYLPVWLGPDEEPLPSPAQVAAGIWAEVSGDLLDPDVHADPAVGTPAVRDIPTFVSVANWQDGFTEPGCDDSGTVCVTLTATPALTFAPGDGTGEIACEDGGTVYDPAAGTPREEAAAAGACAHAYPRRTGVDGRPDAYEATVTVTWSVTWQQTPAGEEGVLDPIPLSDDFPRVVQEVVSVGRDRAG